MIDFGIAIWFILQELWTEKHYQERIFKIRQFFYWHPRPPQNFYV